MAIQFNVNLKFLSLIAIAFTVQAFGAEPFKPLYNSTLLVDVTVDSCSQAELEFRNGSRVYSRYFGYASPTRKVLTPNSCHVIVTVSDEVNTDCPARKWVVPKGTEFSINFSSSEGGRSQTVFCKIKSH